MELFIKIFTYAFGVLAAISIIAGFVFLIAKRGLESLINKVDYACDKAMENAKGLFHYIISEILRVAGFVFDRSAHTIAMVVALTHFNPPADHLNYLTLCITSVAIVYMLLKNGNVDIDQLGRLFDKVRGQNTQAVKTEEVNTKVSDQKAKTDDGA